MNKTSVKKPRRTREFSLLRVLLGVLIGIVILAYLITPRYPESRAHRIICMANLKALSAALSLYADEHGGAYPPAQRWCDSIVDRYVCGECLRCRGGGAGRCHYAMNPLADPNSAPDVVLLFECDGGWNQFGGPELLTTKHHEDKGGCVSFVNGEVKFVEPGEIHSLKWGQTSGPR